MIASFLKNPRGWKRSTSCSLILVWAVMGGQTCLASENSLDPVLTSEGVRWISGPQKVSLGTLADIDVPQGYRLTDAKGAHAFLQSMNNPVPDGLVGILVPDSGKWWAVLEFTETGYLKNAAAQSINPATVLKAIQSQSNQQNNERKAEGMASVLSVAWEHSPSYDAQRHSLEWSLEAGTPSAKVVNHTAILLGRRGALEITAVQPYPVSSDSNPLEEVVQNINFKDGERYADYQAGDKTAEIGLSELIVDDKHPAASRRLIAASGGGSFVWMIWICSTLIGCVAVGGGALLRKRNGQPKSDGAVHTNGSNASVVPAAHSKNGSTNGAIARPAAQKNGGATARHGSLRRKKVFDYSKFYTNVMMELCSSSCVGVGAATNGRFNGVKNNRPDGANGTAAERSTASAERELIISQKNLIEEQKRLMQQQARLIEEQTAFLKRQSEIIVDQYPLKFG